MGKTSSESAVGTSVVPAYKPVAAECSHPVFAGLGWIFDGWIVVRRGIIVALGALVVAVESSKVAQVCFNMVAIGLRVYSSWLFDDIGWSVDGN